MEPDEQKNKLKREILAAAKRIVREKGEVCAREVYVEVTGEKLSLGRHLKSENPVNLHFIAATLLHNGFYVVKSKGCGNGRTTMYAHRRIKKVEKHE